MKEESIDITHNGHNGKPNSSRFTRFVGWLRTNGRRSVPPDYNLNDVLEELGREDHARRIIGPFIRPEYDPITNGQEPPIDPSDGNNKRYKKPPYEYAEPEWYLGWTDGRCGESSKRNEEVTIGQVRRELEDELSSIEAEIADTQTRIPSLENFLDRKKARLTKAEEFYDSLSDRRNQNYMDFSRPLEGVKSFV